MGSVLRFLGWFLFAPYFAVEGLHLRPFFTGDQAFADRVRAQAALSLVVTLIASSALGLLGVDITVWVGAVFYFSVYMLLHLLMTQERERRLRAAYKSMPQWQRYAFGSSAFALALLSAILPWDSARSDTRAAPWVKVHCDRNSSEVTSETCTKD